MSSCDPSSTSVIECGGSNLLEENVKEKPADEPQLSSTSAEASDSTNVEIIYPDPNNPYKCISSGVPMTWNEASRQWLPDVEVDEDFLALYNATYGVGYDYTKMEAPKPIATAEAEINKDDNQLPKASKEGGETRKMTKEEKKAHKREMAKRPEGWIELDEQRNTSVYVCGFPPTISEQEFIEFMSKCGVIMKDPRTGKPKIKLYKTETGELKGDGTCCYIKMESVELALQILDGWSWDSAHKIHVEQAKFELKGEFDPAKKRRRLTGAQKKRFFERQQKIFEWKPDKPRNYRPPCECTLVLEGVFTLEEIDTNAERIFKMKEDTQKLCERFGQVKKAVVYDTNPNGIVTVQFENVEHADAAVQALNGRIVGGRTIQARNWDGREKFKAAETAEERTRRENAWEEFLGHGEEEEEGKTEEAKTMEMEQQKDEDTKDAEEEEGDLDE